MTLSIGSCLHLPSAPRTRRKSTFFLRKSTINQQPNQRFSSTPPCADRSWTPTFSNEKSTTCFPTKNQQPSSLQCILTCLRYCLGSFHNTVGSLRASIYSGTTTEINNFPTMINTFPPLINAFPLLTSVFQRNQRFPNEILKRSGASGGILRKSTLFQRNQHFPTFC